MYRLIARLRLSDATVRRKIDAAMGNSPAVKRLAFSKAYGIFRRAKARMLQEFDEHNITQELLMGPRGLNISGTLDGDGNLFSFIGFEEGDTPVERLRQVLDEQTTLRQTVHREGKWYFRVHAPSRSDIESVTQMPWEGGNSWAYGVESYISGLSHYLNTRKKSGRSGGGIQLPYEYREADFIAKPYITDILNRFRDKLHTIK